MQAVAHADAHGAGLIDGVDGVELREIDGLELRRGLQAVELQQLARALPEILDEGNIRVGLDDVLDFIQAERAAFDVVVDVRKS